MNCSSSVDCQLELVVGLLLARGYWGVTYTGASAVGSQGCTGSGWGDLLDGAISVTIDDVIITTIDVNTIIRIANERNSAITAIDVNTIVRINERNVGNAKPAAPFFISTKRLKAA
ncbi:hypothetical protein CC80DRAFT_548673 [Byssothecium circinans]|uniref:Uncharacterized protein n=1 Tax=Byssothecium circinans TaxID=147558 RepID=A0A6A5U5H9_9PLEO|nr:hypothetical protein CC80DRAFT_548673 [Byssothecium circinans]